MNQKITDLRCREVINVRTGFRLGYVYDVLFDVECGQIVSLIVPGQSRFFGLFGRQNDYIIPWECVKRVGDDIILIDTDDNHHHHDDYPQKKDRRRRFW